MKPLSDRRPEDMITEIVQLSIDPAKADQFPAAWHDASKEYFSQPGCHGVRLLHSTEAPGNFAGVVGWDSKEAVDAAVSSDIGKKFLGWLGPQLTAAPVVTLYTEK
ncbi:antibiotic biosynthesis monooxygenase family protein [Amycolatopsis pithecellobii]|uniref:ABM domain-containing protein n=1 Tax=Amycolatopsis pithecellobii TaxID=664692 RepID=A0A6N7Z126_9PSEU|nr:antibiotic biosynthesis monooxygenase family protein [Amycolatopsis pithecellobii]MTD54449.1 hypothetical protein [Amycolatopsis pithecellobii]